MAIFPTFSFSFPLDRWSETERDKEEDRQRKRDTCITFLPVKKYFPLHVAGAWSLVHTNDKICALLKDPLYIYTWPGHFIYVLLRMNGSRIIHKLRHVITQLILTESGKGRNNKNHSFKNRTNWRHSLIHVSQWTFCMIQSYKSQHTFFFLRGNVRGKSNKCSLFQVADPEIPMPKLRYFCLTTTKKNEQRISVTQNKWSFPTFEEF